jgi:hypothetical protein
MEFIAAESTFYRSCRRLALVTIPMLVTLTGCTQSAPKPILPAEAKLELRMTVFENGEINVTREDQGLIIVEIGTWKASNGLVMAVLILQQLKPNASRSLGFTRETPEKIINGYFEEQSVTLGAKWMARNYIGPIEVQRFTVNDVLPCVFVQQGYETYSDQTEEKILGSTTVTGWYCRQSLDGGAINEFVWNIHVKGIPVR